jgi:hypothetical protein
MSDHYSHFTDWEQEAAKMGQYYKNARVTIAAASAEGVNTSMLGPRKQSKNSTLHEYEYVDGVGSSSAIMGRQFPWRAGISLTNEEPLSLRAWTCQENVLSTRVVHFTSSEVIWECRSQQCFENGATLQESLGLAYRFAHCQDDLEFYWKALISDYSSRALTFETDRLPAISGLAAEIQSLTGSQYLVGLFRQWIHSDLLWRSTFGWAGLDSTPPFSKDDPSIPSWSWVSVTGAVVFELEFCQQSSKHSAIRVDDVAFTPLTTNKFGVAKEAFLRISGPVFPVKLNCSNNRIAHTYELSWPGSNGIFRPDCLLDKIDNTVRRLTSEGNQQSKSFEAELQALYIGGGRYQNSPDSGDMEDLKRLHVPSWFAKTIRYYEIVHFFMVLASSGSGESGTFIRVGLFTSRSGKPPRNMKKTSIKLV